MKIGSFILLLIAIAVTPGCKKYNEANSDPVTSTGVGTKAPKEILTEKPWRLLSYGFDSNKNGVVDTNEESIRDCEKDNIYTFNNDGSGLFAENAMICDGNKTMNQFAWTLSNSDTVLDFYYGKAHVLQLTADTLFIANTNINEVKLLLLYGH